MKIVFFGTPQIAASVLTTLLASEHEVTAVVTQPDRVSGRGKKVHFSEVKETALEAGIPVLQPAKVSDEAFLDELEALGADVHVVTAYAQKLPNRLLEMAPYQCINVHPSLLPKYRGSAPIVAAILNGDAVSGVTIMKMAETMDTGDILMQEEIALDPKETAGTLEVKAAALGGELLLKTLQGLQAGTITPRAQDDSLSTYVRQMKKEAGEIDFTKSAARIERQVRAYDPWPTAYTYLDGKVFKIWEASVREGSAEGAPGTVVSADKKHILIATGDGLLEPESVQIEGKKRMTMEEFLRGKKIEAGHRFA